MNASFDSSTPSEGVLTLHLEPEDYAPTWKKKVNDYKKNITIKGFRKGEAPMNTVRSLYRRPFLALLKESVFQVAYDALVDYIENYNLKTLGTPVLSKHDTHTLSIDNLTPCNVSFRIGLIPEFELPTTIKAKAYRITTVNEENLDQIIEETRKSHASYPVEEVAGVGNILHGNLYIDGEIVSTPYFINLNEASAELHSLFLTKKAKDIIALSKEELEKLHPLNALPEPVEKALKENGEKKYTYKILTIHKQELPELDKDFFMKVLGKSLDTEAQFRESLIQAIVERDQQKADVQLFYTLKETYIKAVELTLPEDIIKNWLIQKNENPVSPEQIEQLYPIYERSLRWSLILDKLCETHGLDPSSDEIEADLIQKLTVDAEPGDPEKIKQSAQKILAKKDSSEERNITQRLREANALEYIKQNATLEEISLSSSEFYAVSRQLS